MKATYKWLILLIISTLYLTTITSCDKDNKDDVTTPIIPEEPVTPDDPTPTPSANPYKILLNVTESFSYSSGNNYENNVYHTNKYEVNEWSKKTVITSFTKSGDDAWEYTYNLPYTISFSVYGVNNKLTLSDVYQFVAKQEATTGSEPSYYYTYDSKARLVECISSAGSRIVYDYDDNYNIIKITKYRDNKLMEECKISYNDKISKTIPLQSYAVGLNNFDLPGEYNINLYEAGFYGVSIPINLISNVIVDSYIGDYQRYEYEYDYTFDSDGYVDTMTTHRYDNTETFITTYKFTWEPISVYTYTNWLFNDVRSPYYRLLPKQ